MRALDSPQIVMLHSLVVKGEKEEGEQKLGHQQRSPSQRSSANSVSPLAVKGEPEGCSLPLWLYHSLTYESLHCPGLKHIPPPPRGLCVYVCVCTCVLVYLPLPRPSQKSSVSLQLSHESLGAELLSSQKQHSLDMRE